MEEKNVHFENLYKAVKAIVLDAMNEKKSGTVEVTLEKVESYISKEWFQEIVKKLRTELHAETGVSNVYAQEKQPAQNLLRAIIVAD